MSKNMALVCIGVTVVCTVFGQIMTKWRIMVLSQGRHFENTFFYYKALLLDPLFLLGLLSVVPAGLCWIAAIKNIHLSYAYPFVGLTFAFVVVLSAVFFHEPLTLSKLVGVLLIVAGVTLVGVYE
ncbi:MAG TPA: EamA family transporter [Spirochaetota bacterium]|nr:EamA family transporter [Spirochaetota bacterium]